MTGYEKGFYGPSCEKGSSVSSSFVFLNTILFRAWLPDSHGLVCILPVPVASQDPPSFFCLSSASSSLRALSLVAGESSIPPSSVLCGILAQGAFLYCGMTPLQPPGEMKMRFHYGTLLWKGDHWPGIQSLCYSVGAPEMCGDGGRAAVGTPWAKVRDQDRQLLVLPQSLVFYPTLDLFLFTTKMLRHRHGWLLLSVGLSISLVTIFHASEQACLFSAVSKSWHGHNNGGQETGAASMWYLVSVIFSNT